MQRKGRDAMTGQELARETPEDRPDSERHEGAITEPLASEGLPGPPAAAGEAPASVQESNPASARPREESEPHEGAITEPTLPPEPSRSPS